LVCAGCLKIAARRVTYRLSRSGRSAVASAKVLCSAMPGARWPSPPPRGSFEDVGDLQAHGRVIGAPPLESLQVGIDRCTGGECDLIVAGSAEHRTRTVVLRWPGRCANPARGGVALELNGSAPTQDCDCRAACRGGTKRAASRAGVAPTAPPRHPARQGAHPRLTH
jgi:hypothetical protein